MLPKKCLHNIMLSERCAQGLWGLIVIVVVVGIPVLVMEREGQLLIGGERGRETVGEREREKE